MLFINYGVPKVNGLTLSLLENMGSGCPTAPSARSTRGRLSIRPSRPNT